MSENRSLDEYDVDENDLEDGFHPAAAEDAREITNDEREYGIWGQCTRDPTSTTGERCLQPARGPHGKCQYHGGADGSGGQEGNQNAVGNDGGAPEENTNAVKHGAYADKSNLYSKEFDDVERQIADDIFADYRDRYKAVHGELLYGHRIRLFKIAVNAVTEIRVENWVTQKPDDLESGTTWIDEETKLKTTQDRVHKQVQYKKSPALAAKKTLSNDNRQWLKSLDLLVTEEININMSGEVDHSHDHNHDLDEETQEIIEDLAEGLTI